LHAFQDAALAILTASESLDLNFDIDCPHLKLGKKMYFLKGLEVLRAFTVRVLPTWVAMAALSTPTEVASSEKATTPTDVESEVDFAMAGWRHNYGVFGGVSGEISLELISSPRAQASLRDLVSEQESAPAPGTGLRALPLEDPLKRTLRFTLSGSQLRFDGTFFDPKRVRIVSEEQQVVYSPGEQHYQVDSRDAKSMDWRDPREVFFDEGLRWESELVDNVVHVISRDRDRLSLRVESGSGRQFEVICDVERNFLPIDCRELKRPDGQQISTEISYAAYRINNETYWFPDVVSFKTWGIAEALPLTGEMPLADGWQQQFKYTVANLKIGEVVSPDKFVVEPPDGTYVVDAVRKKGRFVGELPKQSELVATAPGRRWLPLVLTALVVCILCYLVYRRQRALKASHRIE
jgi:hypothetical protein